MEKVMNDYLEKIEKYLKPLPVSERVDIVKEIKSEMLELEMKKELSPEQILEKLGDPKELAVAYLGDSLTKNKTFSLRRLVTVTAFYGLTGISGMFILPITSVLAVGLMFCGIIAPVAGLIKLVAYLLFGFEVPFVLFQLNSYTTGPILTFPLSVILGVLLFFGGKGCWYLTLKYIRTVSAIKGKVQLN
ncbi:MAG: DUF1700 domain-containing protein [Lachnospiraceae bacterium]|nr:DUF1700 domain-containing protein [Lachnospiraceae bacterium]